MTSAYSDSWIEWHFSLVPRVSLKPTEPVPGKRGSDALHWRHGCRLRSCTAWAPSLVCVLPTNPLRQQSRQQWQLQKQNRKLSTIWNYCIMTIGTSALNEHLYLSTDKGGRHFKQNTFCTFLPPLPSPSSSHPLHCCLPGRFIMWQRRWIWFWRLAIGLRGVTFCLLNLHFEIILMIKAWTSTDNERNSCCLVYLYFLRDILSMHLVLNSHMLWIPCS